MKDKGILHQDLSTLLRGGRAPHEAYDRDHATWPGPRYALKRNKLNDLLGVTAQLAAIIRCNAPLTGGLDAAIVDAPGTKIRDVLLALRSDIGKGRSLSESMARRPWFFPGFYVDIVSAGEQTGQLHEALMNVNEHLVASKAFRDTLAGYFYYLSFVLVVQFGIIKFHCEYVLPQFVDVLADYGVGLPRALRLALTMADYAAQAFFIAALCAVVASILVRPPLAWRAARSVLTGALEHVSVFRGLSTAVRRASLSVTRMVRTALGTVLLLVPVLSTLYKKSNLSHVAAMLERLLGGGVPVNQALTSVAAGNISPLYARVIRRVKKRVDNGDTLTSALEREPSVPKSFRGFVSLGESSGMVPEALHRVAQLYRRDVEKTAKIIMDVVTPLGIVALGGINFVFACSLFSTLVAIVDYMTYSM